jgi:gamma-glutamylaminecyclotransferase
VTASAFEPQPSTRRVFVYGTLKEGFRNFHINRGRRLPGEFVTVQAFPLYVIGEFGLPWLVHAPGQGERVRGQVFEVDGPTLAAMDVLERVADAGWYSRLPLAVQLPGAAPIEALAYFGHAARLDTDLRHHGPIAEYLTEHQALYRRHL